MPQHSNVLLILSNAADMKLIEEEEIPDDLLDIR